MKTRSTFLLLMTGCISMLCSSGHLTAQHPERRSGTFIAEWAQDTASIETYTIIKNHLFGRAIHLYPEPHLKQFSFRFTEDGGMESFEILYMDLKNTSQPLESKTNLLPYSLQMNRDQDSVYFHFIGPDGHADFHHAAPRMDFLGGWIPILGQWQWLSDRALEGSLESDLQFLNSHVGVYGLRVFTKDDTVIFESDISAPITIYPDQEGVVREVDTYGSPWNFKVTRIDPIDVEDYAAQFADKPVVGNPSPYDTQQVVLGSCQVSWAYGRPYKRGRRIFGKVVPYDQVWRTGAGSATILSFDHDLKFGTTMIPKGKYNLYTIPSKDGWTLIFNDEPNAWGSAHRPEFDRYKVAMKAENLDSIVDQFTISIQEYGDGGILSMAWDDVRAKVVFQY